MLVHVKTVFQLTDDPHEFIRIQDHAYEYAGHVARADRAAQGQAGQAQSQAGATASGYGSQAGQIGGQLVPQLERQANNPIGFTPQQQNQQLVASEQGAGGATAGITGQAGLAAARTRNTGALSGVLDQAARTRQQAESQGALGVQNESAKLGLQNQARAQGQLAGLYGTDVGAQLKGMGLQDEDINTEINAGKTGWLQNVEGLADTAGQVYKDFKPGGNS